MLSQFLKMVGIHLSTITVSRLNSATRTYLERRASKSVQRVKVRIPANRTTPGWNANGHTGL